MMFFSIESNEILMYKFFYAPNNLDYKHVAIHDLFMLTNVLLIRRVVQNNVDNFIEDPQCMYVSTYLYTYSLYTCSLPDFTAEYPPTSSLRGLSLKVPKQLNWSCGFGKTSHPLNRVGCTTRGFQNGKASGVKLG